MDKASVGFSDTSFVFDKIFSGFSLHFTPGQRNIGVSDVTRGVRVADARGLTMTKSQKHVVRMMQEEFSDWTCSIETLDSGCIMLVCTKTLNSIIMTVGKRGAIDADLSYHIRGLGTSYDHSDDINRLRQFCLNCRNETSPESS